MRIIVGLLSLFLVSCSQASYRDTARPSTVKNTPVAVKLLDDYQGYLKKKRITTVSSGVSETSSKKVSSLYLMGVVEKDIEVAEARRLLVEIVDELKRRVDESEELRPLLTGHPFAISRIHLSLMMTDSKGAYVATGDNVAKLSLKDGLIRYFSFEPEVEVEGQHLVLLRQELYQEATAESVFR